MINFHQSGSFLVVSRYTEDGNIKIDKVPIPPKEMYNWVICREDSPDRHPVIKSHDGRPVKKMRTNRLSKYRLMELLHMLPDSYKSKLHAIHEPNKYFMDIETEVKTQAIPSADNPIEKILTNAYVDQKGNVFLQGLKELTPREKEDLEKKINRHFETANIDLKVKYTCYPSEMMMIRDLFYGHITKMPWIGGWNFHKFDWSYMCARAKYLGVDPKVSSPTGMFYSFYIRDKYSKEKGTTVFLPYHRPIIDYMDLVAKVDKSIEVKESMSLEWIAQEVLGITKVHFPGNLMELYDNNFVDYLYYNAVDSILVMLIDKEIKTHSTASSLSSKGMVSLHEAVFASDIVENLFSQEYLKRKQVFVDERKQVESSESYSGGFVKEPGAGVHSGIMGLDYESLFPSIMLAFDTGLDNYIGHTSDEGKTFRHVMTGEMMPFDHSTMTWCRSGAVYDKTKDSVMKTVIVDLFRARLEAKHYANDLDEDIEALERLSESF